MVAGSPTDFRSRYLNYDELTAVLVGWANAHPNFLRLQELTKTEEGRSVWLMTVGRDPDRIRPAAMLDASIHASELVGGSACLGIIDDLIGLHVGAGTSRLPKHLQTQLVEETLLYVIPRMCPDGVERVMAKRHFVRSNWRDHRLGLTVSYWRHEDVDGDGLSLLMRVRDDAGDFIESPEVPGILVPRTIEDEGPFFRVYPEGFIENWDGKTIPVPSFMSDTETDLNRNFSSSWRADHEQRGSGAFATSEPESRAVTEFAVRHPNIFAWLSLHTFGGVYIRPLADKPDTKMDPHDAAVFRLLETWGEKLADYPTVSGFHEFTYEPDKPLYGDLANFAYVERGAVALVCELWDFFKEVGFEIKRPFMKNYQERTTREDIARIAAWDRAENGGRIVSGWRAFEHPQLGPVEIGGYCPLVGIWNPPEHRIADVCREQSDYFLRLASIGPRVSLSTKIERLEGDLSRITTVVENVGYLPTYVLGSARSRTWNDPLHATLTLGSGLALIHGETRACLGHLEGWGGNDRHKAPAMARTTNASPRRTLSWIVSGAGVIDIEIGAARIGKLRAKLDLPRV
jgi:hypothetical protein